VPVKLRREPDLTTAVDELHDLADRFPGRLRGPSAVRPARSSAGYRAAQPAVDARLVVD
jgi:hypothetical protein